MLKLLRAGATKEPHQQGLSGRGVHGGHCNVHHATHVPRPRGAWASCRWSCMCFALHLCSDSSPLLLLRLLGMVHRCWHPAVALQWGQELISSLPSTHSRDGRMAHGGMLSAAPREKSGVGREEALVAKLLSCTAGREGRRVCGGRGVRLLCKQQLLFPPFQQLIRI